MLLLLFVCVTSCKDEDESSKVIPYDPSIPIEVTNFSPETGSGGNQFLVYGKNFGTDTSKIKVSIEGSEAIVVSSNGTCIYCYVPRKAKTGPVTVTVKDGDNIQSGSSEKEFVYIPNLVVKTVCGFVDRDGNSDLVDGTYDVAQFKALHWLEFDKDYKNLLIVEDRLALRKLSLDEKKVETLINSSGGNLNQIRAICFSPDYERLYFWNDQESENGTGIAVSTRAGDFKNWKTILQQRNICGGAVHPKNEDIFYNRWGGGEYFRWNVEDYPNLALNSKLLFRVENQFNSSLIFAPSGKFAYITSISHNCIYKVDYYEETGEIGGVRILCGAKGVKGYVDGPGTKAQFNDLKQGTFDEEDNFYICDAGNHCIRKITPEGQVSTFAGRGGNWGYADGDLRKEALFSYPVAIAYNKETEEFYIGDKSNYRIRVVTKE